MESDSDEKSRHHRVRVVLMSGFDSFCFYVDIVRSNGLVDTCVVLVLEGHTRAWSENESTDSSLPSGGVALVRM